MRCGFAQSLWRSRLSAERSTVNQQLTSRPSGSNTVEVRPLRLEFCAGLWVQPGRRVGVARINWVGSEPVTAS